MIDSSPAEGHGSNEKGLSYTTTAGEVCQKLLLQKTKCSCETDSLGLSKNPQNKSSLFLHEETNVDFLFTTLIAK